MACNYGSRAVRCTFHVQMAGPLTVEHGKRGHDDSLTASMHDAVSGPNLGYHINEDRDFGELKQALRA